MGNVEVSKWAKPVFDAYVAGAWILYWTDTTLYWVAKPTVHTEMANGRKRLHCPDGPTLECDIENLYFWHGVMVPAFAVVRPEWITVKHIESEENAEVRRVMVERYTGGAAQYLMDSGAKKIHQDDYGALYIQDVKKVAQGDEPIAIVDVVNSTPEGRWEDTGEVEMIQDDEDGPMHSQNVRRFIPELDANGQVVFKKYMLRVPPTMKTAREACAWTFGKKENEYEPAIET